MEEVKVLKDSELVLKYVDDVCKAADDNKKSLGFLPTSVFFDYARKGKLWVATDSVGGFLGHLLFDHRYPKATVIQMYCSPAARRSGVASTLLCSLKDALTSENYLSIKATVAEDLAVANDFWERNGFYTHTRKKGGQTTGRTLLIRVHELDVPQLFAKSGLDLAGSDTLGLDRVASEAPPIFLVDLNILFDVIKRREKHDVAARLFRSAHSGECRLAISDEMHRELQREARDPNTDPMLCLIDSLPWVQLPVSAETDRVMRSVASIVFPEKMYPGQLSQNDASDVRHIATAILCQLAGFVTRDQRILRAANKLEEVHRTQILDPADFGMLDVGGTSATELEVGAESRVKVAIYTPRHYEAVRELLSSYGVLPDDMVTGWLPKGVGDKSAAVLVALIDDSVVGYSAASKFEPRTRRTSIRAVVNESASFAFDVAKILLLKTIGTGPRGMSAVFDLSIPSRQPSLREVAYAMGFRASSKVGIMIKVSTGDLASRDNWSEIRSRLMDLADVRLPKIMPEWVRHQHEVEIVCPDGNRRFVRLDVLEALLSPVLFALPGRPGVVVPIRPRYSEALLGASKQLSLAPLMQLETSQSRMYVADHRSVRRYDKGGLVLFYESGPQGEKAVIAVARILDVYLIQRDEVDEELLKGSVLDMSTIDDVGKSKARSVCVFDNVIPFRVPVKLERLRSLSIAPSNLVTAYKLNENQVKEILSEGFPAAK